MADKAAKGYTDVCGKHGVWVGDHTGPVSYTPWTAPNTGGDTFSALTVGLRNLDIVIPVGMSVSGTYYVVAKLMTGSGGTGVPNAPSVTKAILVWYLTATPGTQVTAATNLSTESIRLYAIGG